ncbi:MAG: N-acetylmuramoyl-L-alanine amidase [Bacteroidales bacterium]|jgi:N-acetylmuramoyl-L-alanine amidase|nr:N-acetylmuramoyl-L-alanine amidase [Bacteroidales bacterium]
MIGKFLWIIDNGHGKATPGKRSPLLDDGRQLLEYEFNRDIVSRLMALMETDGLSSHNLVPEVEGDISLSVRVDRANKMQTPLQKLYLSIHANAAGDEWSNANGIETFCFRFASRSERLAKIFQSNLVTTVGWRDRGVKEADFYVLKYTKMPAILTENGFYSNPDQCGKLLSPEWRDYIAQAHLQAIRETEEAGYNF